MEARPRLPAMFIATPKDQKLSMWTREKPSPQVCHTVATLPGQHLPFSTSLCGIRHLMTELGHTISASDCGICGEEEDLGSWCSLSLLILQRLLVLAQEALQVLDKQLMDPLGTQDVKRWTTPVWSSSSFEIPYHLSWGNRNRATSHGQLTTASSPQSTPHSQLPMVNSPQPIHHSQLTIANSPQPIHHGQLPTVNFPWPTHHSQFTSQLTMANSPQPIHHGQLPTVNSPWPIHHGQLPTDNSPRSTPHGQLTRANSPWSAPQGQLTMANSPRPILHGQFTMVNSHGQLITGQHTTPR
ncbi:Pollen-specific leucine-rich repeat extensin-like protein 1, partial [Ophiophagus hannah]